MSIQDIINTIKELILNFICSIYKFEICKLITSPESTEPGSTEPESTEPETITSTICPRDTCIHQHSDEDFTMQYNSELNLNSSCDEIKNYILANLERINSDAFSLSSGDTSTLTGDRKKELIFVLENRTDMITNDDGTSLPGIRFKFCCPTGDDCLL